MAKKVIKDINIGISPGTFSYIFKRMRGQKQEYEFSHLEDLRKLLSNEKIKILFTIRHQKPESIYQLSKLLNRNFKSVSEEVKLLQKFGMLKLEPVLKGKRKKLKPVLTVDSLHVSIDI